MVILAVSSSMIQCTERTCTGTTTGKGLTCSMTAGPSSALSPTSAAPRAAACAQTRCTDVCVRIPPLSLDSLLILITDVGSFHLDTTPAVPGISERWHESDGDGRPHSPTARPKLRTCGKRGALQMCTDGQYAAHTIIGLDLSLILSTDIGSLRFRHWHHPGLQRCEESLRATQGCNREGEWSTRSCSLTAGARAATRDVCFRCKQTVLSLNELLES
jgi:hypothetical protein